MRRLCRSVPYADALRRPYKDSSNFFILVLLYATACCETRGGRAFTRKFRARPLAASKKIINFASGTPPHCGGATKSAYMPKRGKYKDTDTMRSDMMKVYKEVYSSCWTQREAWEKTIHHPAPRFYISGKQAYEILRPMFFYNDFSALETMKPTRRRLYQALYQVVKEMINKREFLGKSLRVTSATTRFPSRHPNSSSTGRPCERFSVGRSASTNP